MNKLLLIDGHSVLSRAFYGVPTLTASTGIHTNAVFGFLNILLKCIDEEQADSIAVAFDLERSKLKRTAMYPEYKGTRKPMPEELLEQVPIAREMVRSMNIPIMELTGYEADDLLGTAAKKAQAEGHEVTIVSGDRDLLQLCDEHIKILMPRTSKGKTELTPYYPEDVKEQYRVTPEEFIDLKGLMGDSSDNIPGLPGVGEKTATELIVKYHSVENAYAHLEEIKPPRAQKAFAEHYELAELSKKLATIDTDAPLDTAIAELISGKENVSGKGRASGIYTEAALVKLRELELKTIAARFAKKIEDSGSTADGASSEGDTANDMAASAFSIGNIKLSNDPFLAATVLKDAVEEDAVGLSYFTDGFMGMKTAAAGLALPGDRYYVLRTGNDYSADKLAGDIKSMLKARIADEKTTAVLGLKNILKNINIEENAFVHDISIAAYLLDPGRSSYEYDDISSAVLKTAEPGRQELIAKKGVVEALDDAAFTEKAKQYIALSAAVPFAAEKKAVTSLKHMGMYKLYTDIELPLVYTLNDMENVGIAVNRASLSDYARELKTQTDALTSEIYALAGEEFNINSPKQLGVILFEKLGIQGGKKTKTGYSTAADVLEKLAGDNEIIRKILRYRTLTKLYSTYAAGLDAFIGEDDRIHGTFNQTVTATGRISSTDPNLQNIPVRTEEGKEIRKVFVPQQGYTFVDADYSQVELRILAALSGDSVLIDAYKNAVDIHTLTASQVFKTPIDEVTTEMRRNAKAVNFGIVYGISAFGLGEDLSISRKEANEYIEQYFKSYPKVKEYLDKQIADAKENGYVTTLFGRVRPIPELKSSNFMQRSFGERIAMNSPIQGTAADIMKIAMNNTAKALKGMKSRIVLQVHDELLIETAPEELEQVKAMVKQCMEEAADLPVRLSAEVRSGDTWYDCH